MKLILIKLLFFLLFVIAILNSKAQDTTIVNQDAIDNFKPYLENNKSGQVEGLNLGRPYQRNDTLTYWLLVVDTFVTVNDAVRFPNIKFYLPMVMRGYGLWKVTGVGQGYWDLYDTRGTLMSNNKLVIMRILQDSVKKGKSMLSLSTLANNSKPKEKSQITVENSPVSVEVVDDDAPDDKSSRVYPNPATNTISIELSGFGKILMLEIQDLEGKTLLKNYTNKNIIDISSLPSGIYIFRVLTDDGTIIVHKIQKL